MTRKQTLARKEALWLRQLLAELQTFYDDEANTTKSTKFDESKYYEEDQFYSDRCFEPKASAQPPTKIYCDNNGATALTKNPDQMRKTKHIDIAYHFIRERVEAGELNVTYISTDDMVADDLTNALSTDKHQKHLVGMGMTDSA